MIAAGPWSAKLLAQTGIELPVVPNRVDVLYWKIEPEFKHVYNIGMTHMFIVVAHNDSYRQFSVWFEVSD